MTKEEFDQGVIEYANDSKRLLNFARKIIIHGNPYIFKDNEESYFDFRNRISTRYKIGYYEVYIVGSAKLGFSFLKNTTFSLESDIDVVLVNENLFDYFLRKIGELQYKLDYMAIGKYEYTQYIKFLKYIVKGWIRPDLLPFLFDIKELKTEWFDFFANLSYNQSEVGNHKVTAGIYKNYHHLENYCVKGLKKYVAILEAERS